MSVTLETGTTFRRFGPEQADGWRTFGRAVVADQTAPATQNGCVDVHRFAEVRWQAILPAGVAAVVHYGRWIKMTPPGGTEISQWSEDGQQAVDSIQNSFVQMVDSDPVGVYITGITGTIGSGIQMLYKPLNRP